jgi:hypothetical protein
MLLDEHRIPGQKGWLSSKRWTGPDKQESVAAMTVAMPIIAAVMVIARPDAQSAVHGADARANRAADNRPDWPRSAIPFMGAFARSIDESLSLRADREGYEGHKSPRE